MSSKRPHSIAGLAIAFLFALFAGALLWSLYWLWALTITMPRGLWLD